MNALRIWVASFLIDTRQRLAETGRFECVERDDRRVPATFRRR